VKSNDKGFYAVLALGLFALLYYCGWQWYSAGMQRDVYKRQGVEMSRWEVFIGVKPVERSIIPAPDVKGTP
jgi:hypothetical protein